MIKAPAVVDPRARYLAGYFCPSRTMFSDISLDTLFFFYQKILPSYMKLIFVVSTAVVVILQVD